MKGLLFSFLNLGLLVVFLVWRGRAPLREYLRARHCQLKSDIEAVGAQLAQARAQKEEFSAKLGAIDVEIAALRRAAREEAAGIRRRIQESAQAAAGSIVEDARRAADGAGADLLAELRREFVDLVMRRAEAALRDRLTGAERARIRQEFSRQMETAV